MNTKLPVIITTFYVVSILLGMSFPYGFPLSSILVTLSFITLIIFNKLKIKMSIILIIIMILVFLYLIAMIVSNGILYSNNISDLINIYNIILFYICITSFHKDELKYGLELLINLCLVSLTFVVTCSITKLILLTNNIRIDFFFRGDYYPVGSSLMPDYNIFTLGLLVMNGIILIGVYLTKNKFKADLIILITSLTSISILFSSSRRGIIALIIALIIFAFLIIKNELYRKFHLKFILLIVTVFILMNFTNVKLFLQSFLNNNLVNIVLDRAIEARNFISSFQSRTIRWDESLSIFYEYNLINMIIGNGFYYLDILGGIFVYGGEEYPHNIMISTMLYSGFIGAIILIGFYVYIFILIIKMIKKFDFSIALLNVFILSTIVVYIFISGNSIFSHLILLMGVIIYDLLTKGSYEDSNQLQQTT